MGRSLQRQEYLDIQNHGFRDFAKFKSDLGDAINSEASAVRFYTELEQAAPQRYADFVSHARNDEISHEKAFQKLYYRLTGESWTVKPETIRYPSYKEGIEAAFRRELEAAEIYRDMYLNTRIQKIRDILFKAMTDEMEHAQRFAFLFSLPE